MPDGHLPKHFYWALKRNDLFRVCADFKPEVVFEIFDENEHSGASFARLLVGCLCIVYLVSSSGNLSGAELIN